MKFSTYLLFALLSICFKLQAQNITITGIVLDEKTRFAIKNVSVKITDSNYGTSTTTHGTFAIYVPKQNRYTLVFSLLGHEKTIKIVETQPNSDTIVCTVYLHQTSIGLDTISIKPNYKPDTLLGSPKFSVYDFDFYENNYILLTAQKSLRQAELKLTDNSRNIITSYAIPKEAGMAKEFYHDYMGYTNLICENYIYRVNLYHNRFVLLQLSINDVNSFIKPIVDTINGQLIFTDYWKDYPLFNYYSYWEKDSLKQKLITVVDKELLHAYNFEYYSMKPREMLEARRMADAYGTDKKAIAALMTGFTKSMFYTPLYAPLYVVKDTMCVFDHYKDYLYHLNNKGQKIDSISISYNHPKNWREWKNQLLKDDIDNDVYAVYDKNGHKYLKKISTSSGKIIGKYKLQFHSADKLKIHNGYAYYIYRPFESTQEKYFYRENIILASEK